MRNDAALRPEEIIIRIDRILREIYSHVRKHASDGILNRVDEDIEMVRDLERLKVMLSKLDFGALRIIYSDSASLKELAKKNPDNIAAVEGNLKKAEELLNEFKRGQLGDSSNNRYLARIASNITYSVQKLKKEVNRQNGNVAGLIDKKKSDLAKKKAIQAGQAVYEQQMRKAA